MDVNAIRDFINEHQDGVQIHMVDGTSYRVPHRDYVWFTPSARSGAGAPKRFATSFYLSLNGQTRLINALLVSHVRPIDSKNATKRRRSA